MVCGWDVAPLRGKISLGTDLNVTTAKRTYVLSIKIYGPGEQHNRSHNEKEVDPQNSWFVFMSHNCYSPLFFQIQTLWKFGNTSCNPVLRTEIVGLHSSQGPPTRIYDRRLPIHVDCEMLTVNPAPHLTQKLGMHFCSRFGQRWIL